LRRTDDMIVRLAEKGDLTAVFSLYKEAVGRDGCAWDEEYPGEFWLGKDFETGNLYVLADEKNAPVGAASVVYENELNDQADWSEKDNAREIARVVIGKAYAGQGLAAFMLEKLFDRLKASGVRAVHLSVSDQNPPAIKTYLKLGFSFLGECDMYEHHFYLCEKIL